jgi:hypothetical protein
MTSPLRRGRPLTKLEEPASNFGRDLHVGGLDVS